MTGHDVEEDKPALDKEIPVKKDENGADDNNENDGAASNLQVKLAKPLDVNDCCKVRWRDGQLVLICRIVERRPLQARRKRKKGGAGGLAPDIDSLKPDEVEYYVHYVDHDRRLDEWITLDKFLLETLQRAEDIHKKDKAAEEEKSNSNKSRPSRRRSSAHPSANKTGGEGGSSFSLTGGNWHGGNSGDPTMKELEEEHEEATKVKNISKIVLGEWEVEAWYYSPYPEDYSQQPTLYVCEYCLKYMRKVKVLKEHKKECTWRRPPGKEIYREDDLSVFEVDGKQHRVYCQNLCLLAKLFLDHKTLYYDVDPFWFYPVCRVDEKGAHIVGYFSKEKVSQEDYNLACILTFPQYQLHGYGKFIISLSYELSKLEGKQGSPEKPLSDLGKISYRSYWKHVLLHLLAEHDTSKDISIKDISIQTGIKTEDIISTLQSLDMIKVWKGQHVVFVQQQTVSNYLAQKKQFRLCKPQFLNWEPPEDKKKGK